MVALAMTWRTAGSRKNIFDAKNFDLKNKEECVIVTRDLTLTMKGKNSNSNSIAISVTRLRDLLHFGQLFKAYGNIFCPNCPHFKANFVKVLNSFIFLVKSFLGNFYRHFVTTFFWSH